MSILFSGDFHGNAAHELKSITKNSLLEKYRQEKYDAIRYHIILGDGGFLWPGGRYVGLGDENFWLCKELRAPVFTITNILMPVLGFKAELDIATITEMERLPL